LPWKIGHPGTGKVLAVRVVDAPVKPLPFPALGQRPQNGLPPAGLLPRRRGDIYQCLWPLHAHADSRFSGSMPRFSGPTA